MFRSLGSLGPAVLNVVLYILYVLVHLVKFSSLQQVVNIRVIMLMLNMSI